MNVFKMRSHTVAKSAIERELDASFAEFQLSDSQLLAIAGAGGSEEPGTAEPIAVATPTGHCVTGVYTSECGTKRTVCGACKTLPSTAQWCP
jgi:hypothetical protein